MTDWKVYSDSRASGEIAIVVLKNGKEVYSTTKQVDCETIADGEYKALIEGIKIMDTLLEEGPNNITYLADSEFMVKQLSGDYKINKPILQELHDKVLKMVSGYNGTKTRCDIQWISRKKNLAGHILEGKREATKFDESVSAPKKEEKSAGEKFSKDILDEVKKVIDVTVKTTHRELMKTHYDWWESSFAIQVLSIMSRSERGFTLEEFNEQIQYAKDNPKMFNEWKQKKRNRMIQELIERDNAANEDKESKKD